MVKKGWFSVRRYLKKITDKELEKRLCQQRSLLDLEDAIGRTPLFNHYNHYILPLRDQLKKSQDEGKVSKEEELLKKMLLYQNALPQGIEYSIPNQRNEVILLFGEAILRVNSFFSCGEIESLHAINYSADIPFAYYNFQQKTISIPEKGQNIQDAFIHEYTHHLQNQKLPKILDKGKHRIFSEGHAMNVSFLLVPRQEQQAMNFNRLVGLIRTYNFLGPQFNRTPLPFPKEPYLSGCGSKRECFTSKGKPCVHDLGLALFTVLESREGPGIYKAMLHGEYDW